MSVQYYRASSVALTLDGYNNLASLEDDYDESERLALPNNIDTNLLNCLNYTIGASVPLIDGASVALPSLPNLGLLTLILFVYHLAH